MEVINETISKLNEYLNEINILNEYSNNFIRNFALIFIIVFLIFKIELCVIYKKNGKSPVAAFIPIWDIWTFLEIGGLPGWLCLIPFANIIGIIVAYIKIPIKMGKGVGFAIGNLFLPLIFMGILAFSKTNNTSNEPVKEVSNEQMDSNVKPSEPDLMAEPEKVLENTPNPVEEKPELIEQPALNPIDNVKENEIVSNLETIEKIDDIPQINNQNNEIINAFDMPMPKQDLEIKTSNQEQEIETLDMPKMVNEAINSDLTITKKCVNCGYENPYSNKTCEMCGSTLND